MRSLVVNWEKREKINVDGPTPSITSRARPGINVLPSSVVRKCTSVSPALSFNVLYFLPTNFNILFVMVLDNCA